MLKFRKTAVNTLKRYFCNNSISQSNFDYRQLEQINDASLKIYVTVKKLKAEDHLGVSNEYKRNLENLKNSGWSDIKDFP